MDQPKSGGPGMPGPPGPQKRRGRWGGAPWWAWVLAVIVGIGMIGIIGTIAGEFESSGRGDYQATANGLSNLGLYYRLNETSGTAITDDSGADHGGTLSGAGYTRNQTGALPDDVAIAFNENASPPMIAADSYAPFAVGSSRTFVGLTYMDSDSATGVDVLIGSSNAGDGEVAFELTDAGVSKPRYDLRWYANLGASASHFYKSIDWPNVWTKGAWHWWALTVVDAGDGVNQDLHFWLDGQDQGHGVNFRKRTAPNGAEGYYSGGSGNYQINNRDAAVDHSLKGRDDEFLVYERKLTDAELRDLYQAYVQQRHDGA